MTTTAPTVRAALEQLFEEDGISPVALTDNTVLLETGLDSLGFAVLVTRLETELGYDPFSLMTEAAYPTTFGEFVAIYDKYAP